MFLQMLDALRNEGFLSIHSSFYIICIKLTYTLYLTALTSPHMIMPAACPFIRYTYYAEKLGVISNFANVHKLSASIGNASP